MAFRKKADLVLKYKPDILVIPECEHVDKIQLETKKHKFKNALWFGQNQHKGLGIFSFNDFQMRVLDVHNEDYKMIIPINITNKNFQFVLFAIWANNPSDKDGQYVTQVWKAIHHYDSIITNNKVILTGDFNSNTIWDRPKRKGNHSHVVDFLAAKNVYSIYHKKYKQIHGKEKHPTFYLYKHEDKPYHLDYCFASEEMLNCIKSVKVGDYATWKTHSDHVPLIVHFNTDLYNST
jgi:exodeoxyribonuclease-3